MEQPFTIHIVATESTLRAELARTAAAFGFNAEVYASPEGLFVRTLRRRGRSDPEHHSARDRHFH